MSDKYILEGHTPVPVESVAEWGRWFEANGDKRQIARDQVGPAMVSTVFLGLDHSFGEGKPLLFETMVFDGPLDGAQDRYSTWEQAEAGHAAMIERVKATPPKSA